MFSLRLLQLDKQSQTQVGDSFRTSVMSCLLFPKQEEVSALKGPGVCGSRPVLQMMWSFMFSVDSFQPLAVSAAALPALPS